MINNPLATIVVTPRERYSIVQRTLESLILHTPKNYPIIYVAGGAPPDISAYLTAKCTEQGYQLILQPKFIAPNVARNLGLAQTTTKYIIFLENDVVVEQGWIDALIQCAEEEAADIVSPLCLMGEPVHQNLHSFGGTLIIEHIEEKPYLRESHHCEPICLRTHPKRLTRIASDYSEFHCALVRRSVFDQIGLLDEKIVGAAEHIDLALHLRKLNCRGFAEPTAIVSYLTTSYTIADLDTYTLRWSDEWHFPTMKHLCEKWSLSPNSFLFSDYRSSFIELRERCLLRQEFSHDRLHIQAESLAVAQTIVHLLNQMEDLGYSIEAREKVQHTYLIACELFAASFRATGKTFLAHLVGTSSIMATFGANSAVIAAAMLHAAYEQGRFPHHYSDNINAMRRWLKRRVGYAIETLVYQYSRLQLDEVMQYLPQNIGNMPIELANTILIRIANGIEDQIDNSPFYFNSAAWLQKWNASSKQWIFVFTTVAEYFGMSGMITIFKNIMIKAQSDISKHRLQLAQSSNYYVTAENGSMQTFTIRNILKSESDDKKTIGSPLSGKKYGDFLYAININKITSWDGSNSSVTRYSNCVMIIADPQPWSYCAHLCLKNIKNTRKIINAKRKVIIEICLQVESGTIGILILEYGSVVHQVVREENVNKSEGLIRLHFEIDAINEVGNIVFRGWPSDDGQAHVKIFAINILAGVAY